MKAIIFFIFLMPLFFGSCKEDEPCFDPTNPDCDNYDPCHGKSKVTAFFNMYENHNGLDTSKGWKYYDTDTLLGQSVLLYAVEELEPNWSDVHYTWIIGAETLSGTNLRSISRNTFPTDVAIPVTLIVSKKPHKDCFPDDDGKDTVTRYMVFPSALNSKPAWEGEYIGSIDGNKDEVQIGIYAKDTAEGSTSNRARLSGLPSASCQWQQIDYFTYGYRQFQIEENGNFDCKGIRGLFRTYPNDSIEAVYSEMKEANGDYYDRVTRRFVGRRLK